MSGFITQGGYPDIFGILPVRGRTDARVLLVAGQEGIPLLAFSNRGLGKVGVWCADLLGDWGEAWRSAPPFPAWLAQWVQHLVPPLQSAAPTEVLASPSHSPPAPLPRELTELDRMAGGRRRTMVDYQPPKARSRTVQKSLARDHAWFGVVALLLLLLAEYLSRVAKMGPQTTNPR